MKRLRVEATKYLKHNVKFILRENEIRIARAKYTSPEFVADEIRKGASEDADLLKCHAIMDYARECLLTFDEKWGKAANERFERTRDQRTIHDIILGSLTKFVYGPLFGPNETKIKKYNRIKQVHPAVAFSAPRRFGKSMAIAIICAILFVAIPNMEIAIVAQGTRAANKKSGILGVIRAILTECFGMKAKFPVEDGEHLIAYIPDKRAVHSYSAKAGDG